MARYALVHAVTLCALNAAPWSASADPPQGSSDPCRSKHAGEACEAEDFTGVCRRRRCSRETDDGVRSFHCLVCESGGRSHHHRRHPIEDADAAPRDASEDVTAVDAPAELPVAPDASPPPDAARPPVAARANPRETPRRGLFHCTARPGGGRRVGALLAALAVCAALGLSRRRAG